jgi:hypothetical protein
MSFSIRLGWGQLDGIDALQHPAVTAPANA